MCTNKFTICWKEWPFLTPVWNKWHFPLQMRLLALQYNWWENVFVSHNLFIIKASFGRVGLFFYTDTYMQHAHNLSHTHTCTQTFNQYHGGRCHRNRDTSWLLFPFTIQTGANRCQLTRCDPSNISCLIELGSEIKRFTEQIGRPRRWYGYVTGTAIEKLCKDTMH